MHAPPDDLSAACATARRDGLLHGVILAAGRADGIGLRWCWGDAAVQPQRVPMRFDAIVDVASLTKVIATASACGICIDRGLLDSDAPAARYLPGLAELPGSPILVRDLATHTSGHDGAKADGVAGEALLDTVLRMPPRWPPRTTCIYSCRNLILLGLIVERVSGERLGDFCRRAIFAPLGMVDTAFGPVPGSLRVVPTEQPAGTISDTQARSAGRPIGNAGLFSTAADLAAFCRMMLSSGSHGDTRILGDAALRWLSTACSPPGLPRRSFGWDMDPAEPWKRPAALSDAAIGHAGWTGQSLWIDPARDAYAIVLTNRTHAPGDPANYEANYRFRVAMIERLIARL